MEKHTELRDMLDSVGLESLLKDYDLRDMNNLLQIMEEEDWDERLELEQVIKEYGKEDCEILEDLLEFSEDTEQDEINRRILRELQLLNRKIQER